jgi:hypothetical protein
LVGPAFSIVIGSRAFIVDDCDRERVSAFTWWLLPTGNGEPYAYAYVDGRNLSLHRFLLQAKKGQIVDHIDGDRQNNRRGNLRLVTASQNGTNRATWAASGFKGVQRKKRKWVAFLRSPSAGIVRRYGFATAEEAARAYDELAREHHGRFAALNYPRPGERAARPNTETRNRRGDPATELCARLQSETATGGRQHPDGGAEMERASPLRTSSPQQHRQTSGSSSP